MSDTELNLAPARSLDEGDSLAVVVEAGRPGMELAAWAHTHQALIEQHLSRQGGVLFRGFEPGGTRGFREFVSVAAGEPMRYLDRATPRSELSDGVFTATDYPPSQSIFVHNESSFADTWPLRIAFHCVQPSESGGETPLADVRGVHARLDGKIIDRFRDRGIMYVRNLGRACGLTWQDVFQTEDRTEMEDYCQRSGITVEWLGGDRVRTRQVRPAVTRHPRTHQPIWFNHAAVLHVSTVPNDHRRVLQRMFKIKDLPNNTYYGDGSTIEPEVLDAVREAYAAETVVFPWQRDDVLLLDNMLIAHGRRPFKGARTVTTAMAVPTRWTDVENPLQGGQEP